MHRSCTAAFALALVVAASACGESHDDDHIVPDDIIDGRNAAHVMQGQAHSGRWTIPVDVLATGDQQDVEFNNAPPFDDGANCSGGPTEGALALRDQLIGFFAQVETIGIYNCRAIGGSTSMSLHGVGRALDIMLPPIEGEADNDLGDPIAHYLIENAQRIGIQTIIWDRTIWRVSNSPREHEYTGVNPHVDHLHVEINVESGERATPFFDNPIGPVACADLPPVTAAGVVVDNGDACFQLFGAAQYWRHEASGGQGGLAWTNAFQADSASNWARWSLPLAAAGDFEVQVFIDPSFAVHASTRYQVTASGTLHTVFIDQGNADGWTSLGTFAFAADGSEEVRVLDNVDSEVAAEQHIVADALRVRLPTEPDVGEPEVGEPSDPPSANEPSDPGLVDDQEPIVDGVTPRVAVVSSDASGCAATPMAPCAPLAVLLIARRRRR